MPFLNDFMRRTSFLLAILLIIIFSVAQSLWIFKGRAFDYVDSGLINYITFSQLFHSFFIWNSLNYTGLITVLGQVLNTLLFAADYAFVKVLGFIIGTELYFGLSIAIGGIGTFVFVYDVLEKYPEWIKIFSGMFAFVVFSFTLSQPGGPIWSTNGIFLPFTVFFVYKLFKNTNRGANKRNMYAVLFFLTVFISILFSNTGLLLQNAFLLIAFGILLVLASSNPKRLLFYFLATILLAFGINAPVFVSTYLFATNVGNEFFNSGSLSILKGLNQQTLFSSLQIPASGSYFYIYSLSLLLLVILSLFVAKRQKPTRIPILALLASLFVIVFFYNNFGLPFGGIFGFLLNHFKELLVFRYSGSSFYYIMYFIYGTLAAFSIAYILDSASRLKGENKLKKIALILFFVFVLVLIFMRVYYFDYLPNTTNVGIVIRGYVYNASNYINSQSGNFNVATIPAQSPFMHYYTWYKGTDLYSYFINSPVFTGAYTSQQELFFPISQNEFFDAAYAMQNYNVSNTTLATQFGVLGIKYILVENDEVPATQRFSFNTIYSNLNSSKGIIFVKRFGNTSIYENTYYTPLVYASNIRILQDSSSIFSNTGPATFNIRNTSLYSASVSGIYNNGNTITAVSAVAKFNKPNTTFINNAPTSVTVHVSNATTPFYLVFRETYDRYWAAYYTNGTMIPSKYHILVNGYANAWYVNKTGSYTIKLYYTIQTYAWITWALSIIALGVTIWIGLMGRIMAIGNKHKVGVST